MMLGTHSGANSQTLHEPNDKNFTHPLGVPTGRSLYSKESLLVRFTHTSFESLMDLGESR